MAWKTLIDACVLAEQLHREDCVVIDCRFHLEDTAWGASAYGMAHIPGAVYAHLDRDLSAPVIAGETGRHPLPDVEAVIERLSTWGVDDRVQVFVYDDKGGAIASRLWWMLKWLGHDSVAVLNGGWTAWREGGFPVSDRPATPDRGVFEPQCRPEMVVEADFVDSIKENPTYALVDSRSRERYLGEVEPLDPVAGHIPGAVNLPFADNLDESGLFLSQEQLQHRFAPIVGDRPADHTIFYCGSGVTACHNVLAFAHAGLGMPRLYAGAWSHWITRPDRAVAMGNSEKSHML